MLKNKRMNFFIFILFISSIANTFYIFALPLLAFNQTKSVIDMGLVAAVEGTTALLLFPFIGYFTDKFNPKKLLIYTESIQCITLMIFYILLENNYMFDSIYVVAAIMTGSSQLNKNVMFKIIPVLFQDLKDGNSKITRISLVGDLVGPALATMLIGFIGISNLFLIDSSLSLIAILIYYYLLKNIDFNKSDGVTGNFISEVWKGMNFVRKNNILIVMMSIGLLSSLADNGLVNLLIYTMKEDYKLSDTYVSLVFTFSAFSSIIASYAINKLNIKNKNLYIGGLLLNNFTVPLLLINGIWVIPTVLIITGFFGILFLIVQNVIVQSITPINLLGRVNSFFRISVYSVRPVSVLMFSLIANYYGYKMAIVISTLLLCLTSLISIYLYKKIPENE